MKIECILHRKGGTVVELPGKTYHFVPQDDGRHIADVTIEAHIERFLSIPEGYRLARSPGAEAVEIAVGTQPADKPAPITLGEGETLLGSSTHPATFEIEGKTYTLADVVLRAFQDSGLTVENWNELDDEQRATKIDIVLDGIAAGEIELAPSVLPDAPDARAVLVEQYKAKFGKAPPNTMKTETIKAKLAEAA